MSGKPCAVDEGRHVVGGPIQPSVAKDSRWLQLFGTYVVRLQYFIISQESSRDCMLGPLARIVDVTGMLCVLDGPRT